MMKVQYENLLYTAIKYLFGLGVTFFALFPIYWMLTMALKPFAEWSPTEVHWWPWDPTTLNFLVLFFRKDTLVEWGLVKPAEPLIHDTATKAILNSLLFSTFGTAVALLVGTFAAYAMSRYRAGGDYMFLTFRMLPPIAILMPVVIWFSTLRLMDSPIGMILLYSLFPVPFVIWLMRSFFDDLPREIDEAALMDGCSPAMTFVRVILPLVRGGFAVTALFIFILNWSDLIVALTITQRISVTIPVQIGLFESDAGHMYGIMAALGTVAVIPTLVFGLAIQKYLVRGLTFGAIKG
ncbi:carbohydrate ABC transporter permease [Candidatus Bathyarchaeota archaeon]|nr:carbohydrate ABC transporter permease [Candidatus Bathyarchaeota archaeon]